MVMAVEDQPVGAMEPLDKGGVDGGAGGGVVLADCGANSAVPIVSHKEMVIAVHRQPPGEVQPLAVDEGGVDGRAGGGVVLAHRATLLVTYEEYLASLGGASRECQR